LAVVAYNQPVTRTYVDTVRGVDSSYAVNSLLDKELIEACGRLDAPGRPMLYATTEKFLRVFGLNSLADLPQTELPKPPANEEAAVTVEENPSEANSEKPE
jgi:segregation and condensation protein B